MKPLLLALCLITFAAIAASCKTETATAAQRTGGGIQAAPPKCLLDATLPGCQAGGGQGQGQGCAPLAHGHIVQVGLGSRLDSIPRPTPFADTLAVVVLVVDRQGHGAGPFDTVAVRLGQYIMLKPCP